MKKWYDIYARCPWCGDWEWIGLMRGRCAKQAVRRARSLRLLPKARLRAVEFVEMR